MIMRTLKVLGTALGGFMALVVIGAIGATIWEKWSLSPDSTAYRLTQMAATLEDALARGDRQAANAMLDPAIDVLRTLNDQDIPVGSQMHNCKLAAMHLNAGLINLADGQSWLSKHQFEVALAACK